MEEQAAVSLRLSSGGSAGGGVCPSVTVNTKAPCAVTAPERARAVAVPRKLSRRLIDRVSHPVAGSKMAGLSTCVTPPPAVRKLL